MILVIVFLWALLSPTPESCEPIQQWVGGELVAWVGYPQGWDLPDDLAKIGRVDFASGGVWAYHSDKDRARYVWAFLSYTRDGVPLGAHDFCGPYRIEDDSS